MGLFDGFFGKKKAAENFREGQWLESERDGSWANLFDIDTATGKQAVEVSRDSCYSQGGSSYCVVRSKDLNGKSIFYGLCWNPPDDDIELQLLATRVEGFDGRVIQQDQWATSTGSKCFSVNTNKDVIKAITMIRNMGAFNDYSSMPFYVLIATLKLGQ